MENMDIEQKKIVFATSAAILVLSTTIGIFMLRRRTGKRKTSIDGITSTPVQVKESKKRITVEEMVLPTDWKQIGTVSNLHIYPMKSGRRVNLTKAEVIEIGLKEICRKGRLPLRDRVFIVYRENDKTFISNKTYPKMLKLTVNTLGTNIVELSLEKDKIIFNIPEYTDEKFVNLWKENVPTIDCGDEVGAWISKLLLGKDSGLRVGYWPDKLRRNVTEVYSDYMRVYENLCNDFTGAYSDIGSYLIVNQASIDDLNLKINDAQSRVTANNFRPNIVVVGAEPYSEDKWTWIKIGEDAIFRTFKPCTRCSVTTINPDTLVRSKQHEPIKTLKSYRQVQETKLKEVEGDSPVMGMYMGVHTKGKIKFGDPVYIGSN
ncbi:mitochondrial amidoxime reducing component isoform X2 [Rhodnius prolixus]|uniref:mitochondrial amidoxime reducing component isoform X2 n=1 Tax=Rhodnius prolixus TaxID=13249 RepID=UPI003D18C515